MRQETEDAERVRWVRHLADLLAESPTPMGGALRSKLGDTSLLGAGRRASKLRCQVRAVRLKWLWENHGVRVSSDLLLMDIGTDMVHAVLRSQRDLTTRGGDLQEIENDWGRHVNRVTPTGTRQFMLR